MKEEIALIEIGRAVGRGRTLFAVWSVGRIANEKSLQKHSPLHDRLQGDIARFGEGGRKVIMGQCDKFGRKWPH